MGGVGKRKEATKSGTQMVKGYKAVRELESGQVLLVEMQVFQSGARANWS